MKNANFSTVSVTFRCVDHAIAFRRFIETAMGVANVGGDFVLALLDGNQISHRTMIGHDVTGSEVVHTMDFSQANREIEEAQVNFLQLKDAINKVLNSCE